MVLQRKAHLKSEVILPCGRLCIGDAQKCGDIASEGGDRPVLVGIAHRRVLRRLGSVVLWDAWLVAEIDHSAFHRTVGRVDGGKLEEALANGLRTAQVARVGDFVAVVGVWRDRGRVARVVLIDGLQRPVRVLVEDGVVAPLTVVLHWVRAAGEVRIETVAGVDICKC